MCLTAMGGLFVDRHHYYHLMLLNSILMSHAYAVLSFKRLASFMILYSYSVKSTIGSEIPHSDNINRRIQGSDFGLSHSEEKKMLTCISIVRLFVSFLDDRNLPRQIIPVPIFV